MLNFIKRRWRELLIVLTVSAGCLYWFSWHWKPFTQNAFVFADTRPVSPPVEGFITEIHVKNNQFVRKGDPLFTVFREPYRLNLAVLENEVRAKQAERRALQAEIRSQEAEIRRCQAELANDRYLADRARKMYGAEAVSQAYAEERLRAGEASEAKVEAVRQRTEALKYRCSQVEAQIAALQHRLELSRVLLDLTVVRALADGWVTNLTLTPGGCYKPGDVLCGFIAAGSWRVQANFKESELSEIAEGMSARIWLRQYPGHLYHGVVESTGPCPGKPVCRPSARRMNGFYCRSVSRCRSGSWIPTRGSCCITGRALMWRSILRRVRSGSFSGRSSCGTEINSAHRFSFAVVRLCELSLRTVPDAGGLPA